MKDTRLIKLIRAFSREEIKSFGKYIESPFLKPSRNTTSLFEYIIKYYPDLNSPKLDKETAYKKVYPGEEYSEKKIQNVIFELTGAAEDFIAHNTFMEDEVEYLLNLSKAYLRKNLSSESNRVNKLIEKRLTPGFSPSKDYFSKFRRLNHIKSNYYSEINDYENLIDCEMQYFEASATQFFIDLTMFLTSVKPINNTHGKKIQNVFIQAVLNNFDIEKLMKASAKEFDEEKYLVTLHYYWLKSTQEFENEDHYFRLKKYFHKMLPKLNREEKHLIYSHFANYCVQKVLSGKKEFRSEGLEVYKSMLENDGYSFSENEYMQVLIYRNIIYYCEMLGETVWFKEFIEKYSDLLSPGDRDNFRNYAFAKYYFMKKDFNSSLSSVSKMNHEFFLLKTDIKNILLQIYYELDHIESAFSLCDSYKHFLSTTKEISESHKPRFNNFLKYYFELLKIKCKQSKESASYIRSKIESEDKIVSKIWLLKKAGELI